MLLQMTRPVQAGIRKQRQYEITANHLANLNTTGFKGDVLSFDRVFKANLTVDYSQGPLKATEGKFDIAINGDGFFKVQTGEGVRYTRDGNFILNQEGTLVTMNGDEVLSDSGPIAIEGNNVSINEAGEIEVDGEVVSVLGEAICSCDTFIVSLESDTIDLSLIDGTSPCSCDRIIVGRSRHKNNMLRI